jgi:xanthine dehydrogenase accessory factor
MRTWAAEALQAVEGGEPIALVTVIAAEGSTPREAGARMLVGPDRLSGTIGGGNLEWRAMDQARRMLDAGRGWAVQDYPLGPFLQQCCGGHVRLLLERLDGDSAAWLKAVDAALGAGRAIGLEARFGPDRLDRALLREETQWPGALDAPVLVGRDGRPLPGKRPRPAEGDALIERIEPRTAVVTMFGAGHVGQAIARVLAPLPFRLEWFDSREEAAGPGVAVHEEGRLAEASAAADGFVLILTHNHELDYRLTRAALGGGAWCGLIGSKTKRARFTSRLRADGVAEAAIARLVCPIGIASLKSKAPEVIAVSVAAQLLELVEQGLPKGLPSPPAGEGGAEGVG